MADVPASVRNLNPGAQWPGPVASKWGATGHEVLKDGQGNKIATFPTWEQGAAAHIDLLRSKYAGLPLSDAIAKWSGGNNAAEYVARVSRETGLQPGAVISDELLRSPQGLALVQSMAGHEKGRNGEGIPADAWDKARAMVFDGAPMPAPGAAGGGMLAGDMSAAPAAAAPGGGLLSSMMAGDGASAQASAGLLGDIFSGKKEQAAQPQEKPQQPADDPEPDMSGMMKAGPRRPLDMARVASVLQARRKLGNGG